MGKVSEKQGGAACVGLLGLSVNLDGAVLEGAHYRLSFRWGLLMVFQIFHIQKNID